MPNDELREAVAWLRANPDGDVPDAVQRSIFRGMSPWFVRLLEGCPLDAESRELVSFVLADLKRRERS